MASLQDLGLSDEKIPTTDVGAIPEFGRFAPPPPMGSYRFRLPKDLSAVWEVFETKEGEAGTPVKRIRAQFETDSPLLIVQSVTGEHLNEIFETRVSNVKRMRGKKGSGVLASDLDLLLKALGYTGQSPDSNAAYIRAVQPYGGKEFGAEIRYYWSCDPKRDIYVDNGTGGTVKIEDKKGCGAKYYPAEQTTKALQKIEKVEGVYPYEIECSNPECSNVIRAFANLDNFRS